MRTLLTVLAILSFVRSVPRLRAAGVRRHVEMLKNTAPIQQFAPAASRAFAGLDHRFDITIVAHRAFMGAPFTLVPVDERVAAAWLA